MKIADFADWELLKAISILLQDTTSVSEDSEPEVSSETDEIFRSQIENFVVGDWEDHVACMICIKCEEPFKVDPCGEENLTWCDKKKVLVPKCPHCGANDVET